MHLNITSTGIDMQGLQFIFEQIKKTMDESPIEDSPLKNLRAIHASCSDQDQRDKLIASIKSLLSVVDPPEEDPNEFKHLKTDDKGPSNLSKFKLEDGDDFSAEYSFCVQRLRTHSLDIMRGTSRSDEW